MSAQVEGRGTTLPISKFIWGHLTAQHPITETNMTGRVALVTGGNAGIGYETVLHLARNNPAKIIIASRNVQKSQQAVEKVYKTVPSFRGKIDVLPLDLASFSSVKSFTDKINKEEERLDVVVANAGMMASKHKQTGDGHEQVIQVNSLSTGLVAMLLVPILSKTADLAVPVGGAAFKPRIVIVASEVHFWTKTPFVDPTTPVIPYLDDEKHFGGAQEQYNISKLFDLYIAREMAKLPVVQSGKITVCSVNPGFCVSAFRDDLGYIAATISNFIAWRAEFGARSVLYAAVTETVTPGAYVSFCKESPPSTYLFTPESREVQAKFWKECLELWSSVDPVITKVGQ